MKQPARSGRGWLVVGVALWLLVTFAAWHSDTSAVQRARDYRESIEAALGTASTASLPASGELPAYPRKRALRLPVKPQRVGMLEMLDLQGCELGVLVGERNAQLGRVMAPSERLIYEARVLRAIPACPTDDPALRDKLAGALEHKRAELPRHRLHALWGGAELRGVLTHPGFNEGAQVTGAVVAMRELGAALMDPASRADGLRASLEHLHAHRAAGGVLRTAVAFNAELVGITAALRRATDGEVASACRAGRRVKEAFRNHYPGSVQPALARVQGRARALLRSVRALREATVSVVEEPPELTRYLDALEARDPASKLRDAAVEHARAIARFGHHCQLEMVARR